MIAIEKLSHKPRVTVRRPGLPTVDGKCVVYWMQRAQRAFDNPALDVDPACSISGTPSESSVRISTPKA